jgi:hypothetical protein
MTEFAAGTVEATAGMATFTFELSPTYAIIHPDRYVEHQIALAKGLAHGVTHPVDFAKAFVDWDTWAQSPGRALGHLLPMVALTIASAGGGAGGKAIEASEVAEGLAATEGLEGIAQEGLEQLSSAPALIAEEEAAPGRPVESATAGSPARPTTGKESSGRNPVQAETQTPFASWSRQVGIRPVTCGSTITTGSRSVSTVCRGLTPQRISR